jgi:KUP system potassium uptake protein
VSRSQKAKAFLILGALGVVFGDIGTSPLYALHAVFGPVGLKLAINQTNVYGIISLVVWGIMALVSLIKSSTLAKHRKKFYILLGIIGVSLFYGDSVITPAISVLSAVEGLKVVNPSLHSYVLPITLAAIVLLFWIQKYGTTAIGRLFGPVMLVWFVVIGVGGGWQVWQHPGVLEALLPTSAIRFFVDQPLVAFGALGAVVLAITGAEALYADMGHFGRPAISKAWFAVVFPALALCYMGQGALLLANHGAANNPFMLLFPSETRFSVVILATVATLIASQAVISGAFSLTRQVVQLDFLPKMVVRHTSVRQTGQIYLPFVNTLLFIAVVLLVLLFGSSGKLANAYGIAVSWTLAIDTILFIVVMKHLWQKSKAYIIAVASLLLIVDLSFPIANLPKVLHGGWVPVSIALIIFVIIDNWMRGERIVIRKRKQQAGTLDEFIEEINNMKPPLKRVPGQAVYVGHHTGRPPLALKSTVEKLHELNEKVVLVSVKVTNEAHVPEAERAVFDGLKDSDDGISQLTLYYGFHDHPHIPKTLASLRRLSPELDFDQRDTVYFISLTNVVTSKRRNLAPWRKSLYSLMARNSLSATDYYKLPVEQTVEMRSLIEL